MIVFFFKIIYILRKNYKAFQVWYAIKEFRYLFPDRVFFPKFFPVEKMPQIYLDNSSSRIHIGDSFFFRGNLSLLSMENGILKIGQGVFFNNNCSVNCFKNIEIGDNCLLGENVKIYDHNHRYADLNVLIKDQGYTTSSVKIGENCWVGSDVVILKGVTIGKNSVIGAGCLIYKSIPERSIIRKQADLIVAGY